MWGLKFGDVLNRLLTIVSLPINEALQNERVSYSKVLVNKTCRLIACVISKLSNLKGGPNAGLASIANRVSIITQIDQPAQAIQELGTQEMALQMQFAFL